MIIPVCLVPLVQFSNMVFIVLQIIALNFQCISLFNPRDKTGWTILSPKILLISSSKACKMLKYLFRQLMPISYSCEIASNNSKDLEIAGKKNKETEQPSLADPLIPK